MREIKFRAWHREDKEILYPYQGNAGIDCSTGRYFVTNENPLGLRTYPSVILMQFTGLKDKNGRDIYEGDLISVNDLQSLLHEIRWVGAGFFGVSPVLVDFELHPNAVKDAEVIGNIYENPELMSEANPHDWHNCSEEGCGAEEEEEEESSDYLLLESIRADVEADELDDAQDLDEGVVITTTKTLNMPIYYEDEEVIIQ